MCHHAGGAPGRIHWKNRGNTLGEHQVTYWIGGWGLSWSCGEEWSWWDHDEVGWRDWRRALRRVGAAASGGGGRRCAARGLAAPGSLSASAAAAGGEPAAAAGDCANRRRPRWAGAAGLPGSGGAAAAAGGSADSPAACSCLTKLWKVVRPKTPWPTTSSTAPSKRPPRCNGIDLLVPWLAAGGPAKHGRQPGRRRGSGGRVRTGGRSARSRQLYQRALRHWGGVPGNLSCWRQPPSPPGAGGRGGHLCQQASAAAWPGGS